MISIIGTVGVPSCYGGFESLVENLLPSNNIDVIYCSSKVYSEKKNQHKGARLKYLPLHANGVQSIPYDILSILHTLFCTKNDALVLGVSGAIAIPLFKLLSKRKVVTNIDGLEWKRDKWGRLAKWYLRYSEKIAVKYSDVIIADNQVIAEHVFEHYGVSSKVIAYGGDHAVTGEIPKVKDGYALSICRIEPENNVQTILEGFLKRPDKDLKFIGNWDKSDYGRRLKKSFSTAENIEIIDSIYDVSKLFDIRKKASIYIHGHSAGGTNPSLVEMMFFDIPIICFDCGYNRASTEGRAAFFQDSHHLSKILQNSDSLSANGVLEISHRRYVWSKVKDLYEELFD